MPTTEERLAALETLVAGLSASQTAGTPSSYYTSKYSGEEIDALLDWVAAQQEEST